jgi:hypothetical protein
MRKEHGEYSHEVRLEAIHLGQTSRRDTPEAGDDLAITRGRLCR